MPADRTVTSDWLAPSLVPQQNMFIASSKVLHKFISSGPLSVVAGRKPARVWMKNNCGMNVASATITLVGFVFLSTNLVTGILLFKSCQSAPSLDLCSLGLVFLVLIFTLLELCVALSVSAIWCKANCFSSREATSSTLSSVESGSHPH
ncbi:membrane-spanning 4-domains subfamily A member 3 [Phyllostomus hastatus]|uniref:membrane-spanning 4-domains subfamily A member 3 n=1 Tax=Phyllostomus hastatus TaxID=9423 RepID=UPI001E68288A|nr:membrane-spanning 4-domains subfamily A member 3 [Phyllostomus hastatus]